jgi:alkanesulfonate monooxygenase SsuD/methylene tetrahydromethanopterin reductase-like flavin-dependent oxidoreductase (luciferase family)
MLTALAVVTQRLELGTLVLCSQFRNPAILAKMAATLDAVSGGRLIFGIGAGWNEPEFEAFGVPFDHRVDRFEEAIQIIAPLLRQGRVDFEGRFYSARNCEIAPPNPREGGPPILIGAWGPRMLRLAARYADIWNAGYYSTADTFAEQRAAFEAARAEVGGDAEKIEVTALLKVGWPDLGKLPGFFEDDYLTGSAEELAAAFRGWEESGVTHVICQYHPNTPEALGRLIAGLKDYRSAERTAPGT